MQLEQLDEQPFELENLAKSDICGINEMVNPLGAQRCQNNFDCNGMRKCSSAGWCTGQSGCVNGSLGYLAKPGHCRRQKDGKYSGSDFQNVGTVKNF